MMLEQPFSVTAPFGLQAEVAPGIHWLRLPLPFEPENHINVWLIEDEAGLTAVDTGLDDPDTRRLWLAALAGRTVRDVFVTHHHPDHIALAAWFAESPQSPSGGGHGATVHLPAREAALAARLLAAGNDMAMKAAYQAHGMPQDDDFAELRQQFYRTHVTVLPADIQIVSDRSRFVRGGATWEAWLAGGHTPAHLLLYCAEKKVLIAGDHILPDIVTNIGALSFDDTAASVADYLASLLRCAALPADTLVLPAHGLPFYGLAGRCDTLRTMHAQRMARVEAACARADTVWQMLPSLYGRPLSGLAALLGFNQTKAYLDHLTATGRVIAMPDADGHWRYRPSSSAQPSFLPCEASS